MEGIDDIENTVAEAREKYFRLKEVSEEIGPEVMTVGEFIDRILDGIFIDYDGYCRLAIEKDNKLMEIMNVYYSISFDETSIQSEKEIDLPFFYNNMSLVDFCKYFRIKKVVWYNR